MIFQINSLGGRDKHSNLQTLLESTFIPGMLSDGYHALSRLPEFLPLDEFLDEFDEFEAAGRDDSP